MESRGSLNGEGASSEAAAYLGQGLVLYPPSGRRHVPRDEHGHRLRLSDAQLPRMQLLEPRHKPAIGADGERAGLGGWSSRLRAREGT